jgi:hypothetical protein
MPISGEEIRANLTRFVARWSGREGYERGEAQTFLTELFDCYGQRLSDVAEFERASKPSRLAAMKVVPLG